jgi:hypothetical protein
MTMAPELITVQCPKCGRPFETCRRASINLALDNFSKAYVKRMSTATCPNCACKLDLGCLIVGTDNVWRWSPSMPIPKNRKRATKAKRSPEQIAMDLSIVLMSALSEIGKRTFIDSTLWCWSEQDGKYATRFCSEAVASAGHIGHLVLRHDHAIPRKVLADRLMTLSDRSPTSIQNFLERYCLGVTITKADDDQLTKHGLRSKMPDGWDWGDPLARYSSSGVSVVDRSHT